MDNICQRLFSKANIGKETNLTIAKFLKEASYSDVIYANSLKNQLIFLPPVGTKNNKKSLKCGLASVYEFQTDLAGKIKHFG